ncbi:MAG: F0F1 ATP synthase subunit A [Coprobacillaceae bacterium]
MPNIVIQTELIFSLIIIAGLCIFFVYAGNKIKAANPLEKPKGLVLVCETGVEMIYNYMKTIMPRNFERSYYPYFAMIFLYVVVSNWSGLIGFTPPTSSYSVTLAITLITFVLIQHQAIKKKGGLTYIKDMIWPPTNIFGVLAPLISLSMRLFGNILSGSIIMTLVYGFTSWLSGLLIPIDFIGPFLGGILHIYFDIFSGAIQTVVFVTLSSIFIAMEAE